MVYLRLFYGRQTRTIRPILCYCRNRHISSASGKDTHFGYQTVTEDEKEQKVHEVFESVATKYDLMNDAMSFGIHRIWKSYFVHRLNAQNGTRLIDVAGGTGDIALRFLQQMSQKGRTGHVTVCDINQPMLDEGEKKAKDIGIVKEIEWVCGNAESLPFDDGQFDAYTIAFGIRNCTHVDKVLQEAHRVLKDGGKFMCLEFSKPQNIILDRIYDWYSFQIIPVMGQLLAGDWQSYQYLVESIRQFPKQEEFRSMINDAGFKQSQYENLTNGIVAIYCGKKINKQRMMYHKFHSCAMFYIIK